MKYRRFGKTEIQMPVITCGGMRFQQSWKTGDPISEESQRNVEACIKKALDSGIYHIETARGYGTSEEQLGRILPGLPRDEIVVQTKVGPAADVEKFKENFELSMRLLQLDYIDLFSFHGINDDESFENTMRCFEIADAWRREGRIRHIGFSTHGPTDIIVKAIKTDLFSYVNLHWFFIYQDNWPAVQAATERDMGVFIISPNDKGGMLYKQNPTFEALTKPLHPMVFNGLFCLARPEVHTLSCGVARPEEFDMHLETAEKSEDAATLVAPIIERLEQRAREKLGENWVATWKEGLPRWQDTPGEINIPIILWLWNLVKAFDLVEYAKMRYNLLGNGGPWFPGNNAAHVRDYDLSECLAASPHRDVIPDLLAEAHELLKGEEQKRLQEDE